MAQLGVHRNRYCKIRPEPELTGTDEKFRPELPAGTGTDFINRNRVNTFYRSSMFQNLRLFQNRNIDELKTTW